MDKYIEMLKISAQIEVLQELPYKSVYSADSKLDDLRMKSAVMMDDLIKTLNDKREALSVLNGSKEISKLKKVIGEHSEEIGALKERLRKYEEVE